MINITNADIILGTTNRDIADAISGAAAQIRTTGKYVGDFTHNASGLQIQIRQHGLVDKH